MRIARSSAFAFAFALALLAPALAACNHIPPAPPRANTGLAANVADRGLVINEVAAAGAPDDWFEVVNTSAVPIDLSDFVYTDTGDRDRARAFPGFVLQPGERHVQYVSDPVDGFQLAGDEALWLYRADGATVDTVDWSEGDSPRGGSYARLPDATGAFARVSHDSQGEPNTP